MPARAFPTGPKTWLPFGHLIAFARDPLAFFDGMAAKHGDLIHFRGAGRHYYLLNHPDLVRETLIQKADAFSKGEVLAGAKKVLGESLFTSDGEAHQAQRRAVQPAFHQAYIDGYAQVMSGYTRHLQEAWTDGGKIDLVPETLKLTLAIVGKTLFDADLEQEADHVRGAMLRMNQSSGRLSNPFAGLLEHLPLASNRRFYAARAELDALIYAMIAARREHPHERKDLLSLMLHAGPDGRSLSDPEVRDQAMGLFLAGYETMANALSFGLYVLAAHPELQERARAEVRQQLGARTATAEDSHHLPYLRQVFTEALRLYPPAWVLPRRATQALTLGPWSLEAGDTVLISPWVSHRDARFFTDPGRFDPERWRPEAKAQVPAFAYYPFGAGQRSCVGESYSWMEGLLVLATTLQSWRLDLADAKPLELSAQVLLKPQGRLLLRTTKLETA
jgi:cytochrome P450